MNTSMIHLLIKASSALSKLMMPKPPIFWLVQQSYQLTLVLVLLFLLDQRYFLNIDLICLITLIDLPHKVRKYHIVDNRNLLTITNPPNNDENIEV